MLLPISSLRLDFQPAENLDPETVYRYVVVINDGQPISPVRVYFDGEEYWLNDGFHRVAALREVGRTEVEVEIVHGTYEDMEAEFREALNAIKADFN